MTDVRWNVHHWHDPESVKLAARVVELLGPESRAIPMPVDDVRWTGLRIFDEQTQRSPVAHHWARENVRNLEPEAQQLFNAVDASEGPVAEGRPAHVGWSGQPATPKGVYQVLSELGVEPRPGYKGRGKRRRGETPT